MARIFLCHASEDKRQVRDAYQRLAAIPGFEPWLDEEELLPGQLWEEEIPRALKASDFILIFFSTNSVAKRGYIQREMKLALDAWQEIPGNLIHTIPVRLDECDIPEPFRRYHYANLFDPRGFDRLVRALRHGIEQRGEEVSEPLETPPTTPESTITQDSSSGSNNLKAPILGISSPSLPLDKPDTAPTITLPLTFTNSIGMEFVLIPAGTFMMGSPDSDPNALDDEKPLHQVTISKPFYLGKYEVTQAQWKAVMGDNPSRWKGDDNRPVENVLWDDAQQFIHKLNERERGTYYRLPTEAEWEYAARAGTTTLYSFGDDASQLDDYAWYDANSGNTTHTVGKKGPNQWGLYDMHGNVWEWVQDLYGPYSADPVTDPTGPATGSDRVLRSGSWFESAQFARSACCYWFHLGYRIDILGFRCAMSVPNK